MSMDDITTPGPAETPAPDASAPEFRKIGPMAAATLDGGDVQANLSAIVTANAGTLNATGSAIAMASVGGDSTVTACAVPLSIVKGNATIQQSYASAMIVSGETKMHQAASPLIIGRVVDMSQTGACAVLASEANISRSWVGMVLSTKTNVSDDSRVIISTKAAMIIALALFGGFGLVALVGWLGVRRVMHWRPTINVPGLPDISKYIPNIGDSVADVQSFIEHVKQFRAA
jgi:hypothetical protein